MTRNEQIIAHRKAGLLPWQIAPLMGVTRNAVIGVCNRAGLSSAAGTLRGPQCRQAVLTEAVVREARRRVTAGETMAAIAREYGVNDRTLRGAVRGLTWGHVA